MRKNIQQRKADIERQKIALLGKEKALKERERKDRTRKLIELGGLIAKAGLDAWDTKTLYGALLWAQDSHDQHNTLSLWHQRGASAFDQDTKKEEGIPLIIQFKDKPSPEARTAIRALGFRWNSIRQEWQGIGKKEQIEKVVAEYVGKITAVEK